MNKQRWSKVGLRGYSTFSMKLWYVLSKSRKEVRLALHLLAVSQPQMCETTRKPTSIDKQQWARAILVFWRAKR